MNYSKILCVIISAVFCFMSLSAGSYALAEDENLVDSGIDYTESTDTLSNPGAGYTSTLWYTCKPGNTPVKNPSGNLVLMFINIGAFSSGSNGVKNEDGSYTEGTDLDLDQTFFDGLRGTFENCRRNGCTMALRFRYDENGKTNPEPATFDQVLRHINQIKASGLLEEYKDILMFVETGFVGAWGEQHSGKYTSLEYKAKLVDAMLDLVPDDIPITVRTPNTFAKWAGIQQSEIDGWISEPGSDAARIGMYNDGYMGSDSDLGTYSNREKETTWLGRQTLSTYYGGEFSGNLDWAKKYDTYFPENAIPEMYKTHLSYINSNIYSLYKDYTFGKEYDVENVDNSAYYGQTVFKFIRDHLGYRFVLRNSKLSGSIPQGDTLKLNISVENTGFANPIRPQKAEIILENNGDYSVTEVDIDTRKWLSCTTSESALELKLPGSIEPGKWNAYLRFSVGNEGIIDGYKRTVKFANNNIWNPSLGANYMGSFEVTESDDMAKITDDSFYQENAVNSVAVSDGSMYTINNMIILDGVRSSDSEWTDSILAANKDQNKLYITNDDKNLYVMAEIDQNAASPVYNLQIHNADENNKFYWMYYMQNGYVYFNNGSYDGCECKRQGKYVEFKIPFGSVMNIYPGTTLKSVRVSIQDSSNEWVNVGDLTSGEYVVTDTFDVYSVCRNVNLKEHDNLPLKVELSLDDCKYQWLHDGQPIENAAEQEFTIKDASEDSKGVYSVKVTSASGTVREVEICNVLNVYSSKLLGSVNGDNKIDISDAVLLQKYLIKLAGINEIDAVSSDVDQNMTINVFDLICLKRILIGKL